MPQTLFHGDQHIRVAAGLDEDDPVRVKTCKMQRRGEEVPPMHAPENRALQPRQDTGQKDRCRCIVGKFPAACDFVKSAAGKTAPRQVPVDRVDLKGQRRMPGREALDAGDVGAQFLEDG